MFVLPLLLAATGALARTPCRRDYWRGQCTACPGYWYQTCRSGESDIDQRGCGFLGCETKCRDPDGNGYDEGCGCGQGKGCLHCTVGGWGSWGGCNKSCGGGQQTRSRPITRNRKSGGNACPALTETRNCNTHCCKRNCAVSGWSAWGACSKQCGTGQQTRTRSVTTNASCGGNACPSLSETRNCNTQCCPVACAVSNFSAWGACNKQCGGGQQTRTRTITRNASCNGQACPALSEARSCNTQCCPVACQVGAFGDFGQCSKTCGTGTQTRTRSVTVEAGCGGQACPTLTDTQECNKQECPIDCVVSDFGEYGECSETCGPGKKRRTRTITRPMQHNGEACPALFEEADCKVKECPIDCVQSNWTEWSECDVTCGGATQKRTRTVKTQNQHGGEECGLPEETRPCGTDPCPVDCKVSGWGAFGECSKSCGGGTHKRTRTIEVEDKNGGEECPALEETAECNKDKDCPVDCELSEWTEFGECDKTCGTGKKTKTRTITKAAAFNGKACEKLTEDEACNTDPCPVDCVVSDFSEWGECDADCNGGEQVRTRSITQVNENGGQACPEVEEKRACNTQNCPTPAPSQTPAPVIDTPAPVIDTPAPVIDTPAPVSATPAPVTPGIPLCTSDEWKDKPLKDWWKEACALSFSANDCKNKGCKYSKKKKTCKAPKKVKCKKLKFELVDGDKGAAMCDCFSLPEKEGCQKVNKKGKYKSCKGSRKL